MKKILRFVKTILICGFPILFYHFFYMIRFAKNPKKYDFAYRYKITQKEIRFVLKFLHVDYNAEGIDEFYNLNKKCLIISNHLSVMDPLILIAKSEKPITFISKIENFKVPFLGKVAKALEVFPLDRKNIMNQLQQIKDIVTYLKDESKPSIIVYIEGTRNKKPENPCLEFHPGTLKLAQMAGVPLFTLSTYGTFRVLSLKSSLKRVPTYFNFIKVREAEEIKAKSTTELANELKNEIDASVDDLRRKDLNYFENIKISKRVKELETFFDTRVKS